MLPGFVVARRSKALGTLALAALILFALPAHANGGGVIDRDTEYRYDGRVFLNWLTGDGRCDRGGFCFRLTRPDHRKPFLSDLDTTRALRAVPSNEADAGKPPAPPLEARDISNISAPDASSNLVLAQVDARDGPWVIYDLTSKQYVLEDAPRDVALQAWTRRGLAPPTLISAEPGPPPLPETTRSEVESYASGALLLSPCLLLVLVGAGVMALIRRLNRRRPSAEG